jgi:precorrin-2 dehydrogenase / sirohydrochlorin ferrochelatase
MPENLFPAFIKLAGRRCLVIGAGKITEDKVQSLLKSDALVTVVAPRATPAIQKLAAAREIAWRRRAFRASDVRGFFLAVAATADSAVNHSVFRAAQEKGILCNAVDDPPNCDFYFPAVVRRGALQVAISTSGESPALAQRLRRELEANLDESLGKSLRLLGNLRRAILATNPATPARKQLLHLLASREGLAALAAAGNRNELAAPGVKL